MAAIISLIGVCIGSTIFLYYKMEYEVSGG